MERSEKKTKFYNSKAWRKLAHCYTESKAWCCENCHNANIDYTQPLYKQLHCHHKIELTDENIDNPEISLNENNLILLCRACHNAAHGEDGGTVIREDLFFDENGMPRKKE